MIRFIRKRRRFLTAFFVMLMVNQLLAPGIAHALTGGPTQPEVQSFQPASTSDMVDLFTGDFSYNIPLFELPGPNGGYPFNLSYQSGIGMDQEASWVGLGWNLNPGAITRQMRGLPDEFKGDLVRTKMTMKPSVTVGLSAGVGVEILGGDASLGLGFSVNHNNYKGIGYSIDASIGYTKTVGNEVTRGIGLNVSLDSKEGANVTPSLSLGGYTIGVDYNSKQGLHTASLTYEVESDGVAYGAENSRTWRGGISTSSSISLAHPAYTPQISMPMKSINMTATIKAGAAWWGIFGAPWVRGFYNEQRLKDDNKLVEKPAFGYLNYEHADKESLMDFNREKDGSVTKEAPNLAIPSMTYDIYSVNAQGMSAMYRPFRNDFGVLHDPLTISTSTSGSFGADIGPTFAHVGANLTVTHSKSVSGAWTGEHPIALQTGFVGESMDKLHEPWYFKAHGEPNPEKYSEFNAIGREAAMRVKLEGSKENVSAVARLEGKTGAIDAPVTSTVDQEKRKTRNQVIQPITNAALLNAANEELISSYIVEYYDGNNDLHKLDRGGYEKHHIAGFTALSAEGLRYIYALPAYNKTQVETTLSVLKSGPDDGRIDIPLTESGSISLDENTDQFLKQVVIPEYTHSHLLTSIIGPDYVDVDNNGVSDKDLGYWVKFTYKLTTTKENPYRWRDPYSKAHHQEGYKTDPGDDKASFTYGEKEVWYLVRAETKSHVAIFDIAERSDGMGVQNSLQNQNLQEGKSYKLTKISLLSKRASNIPIKVVRLNYALPAGELCQGVYNNATGGGKLTLEQLHFEYGNSTRGTLNPYKFFYHATETAENPRYEANAYDRWGNYKPYPAGKPGYNRDFPYVDQTSTADAKADLDKQAAVWSLKEIQLPSGGTVLIDYEVDDYAYVQHLTAMQMTPVVSNGDASDAEFNLSDTDRKVTFKLEKPILGTLTAVEQRREVLKYLDENRKQLYFKYKINLRSPKEDMFEYITGYVDIDFAGDMSLKRSGEDVDLPYEYGVFELARDRDHEFRHPFSLRTWQHLRSNQPQLANSGARLDATDDSEKRVKQIKRLGNIGTSVRQMFTGFHAFCDDKQWGREVKAGESWIRLKSPDKVKYGGGLRVKQITMKDGWTDGDGSVYGQYYEYTTEENDQVISSGVAAYEPIIGGEENPLRYAKKYVKSIPLLSKNNLFFEYPVNESYFPGAQVGYSKVSVMSLAAAALKDKIPKQFQGTQVFPENVAYGTTGMTVHEFYTAKDFPVITDETEKLNKPFKLTVPVPLMGSISVSKLTASQGYSIITNDMHGRQKMVSNYRQTPQGSIESEPISWVKYNYMHQKRTYDRQTVLELRNTFKDLDNGTMEAASSFSPTDPKVYTIGQETEFFYDLREFEDETWGGGASYNTEVVVVPLLFVAVPITLPSVWPNVSQSTVQLRTAVTNKVIFKSGILESTEAFDGGSLVKTQNLKWNKQTGGVVLTKVNNNFDDAVYAYDIPAFTQYKGMGAAYKNVGLNLLISNVAAAPFKETLYHFTTSTTAGPNLFPGDEMLLYSSDPESTKAVCLAVYNGQDGNNKILYSSSPLSAREYRAVIIRSGYRNQLTVSAGSITALKDPSVSGEVRTKSKQIKVPR